MSDPHLQLAPYALDALDDAERAAFEDHLTGCEDCRRELAEFGPVVADLSALSQATPPPPLRGSVLSAIGQIRQDPPESVEDSDRAETAPAHRSEPSAGPGFEPAAASAATNQPATGPVDGAEPQHRADSQHSADSEHTAESEHRTESADPTSGSAVIPLDRERRRRRVARTVAAVVSAAALVAAIALGGWAYGRHQLGQSYQADSAAISRVLSAPDAKIYHQSAPNGMRITYVVSDQRDAALAVPENVADPGEDRTYQLWTVRVDDGQQVFTADRTFDSADGPIVLTGQIDSAAALGVTDEPDGGSQQPTTQPFAVQTL